MDQRTFYELITEALTHPTSEATIDFLYNHGVTDIRIMTQAAGAPLLWQDEMNGLWYTGSDIEHMATVDGTIVLLFTGGELTSMVKGVPLSKIDKTANATTTIISPVAVTWLSMAQRLRGKRYASQMLGRPCG